MKISSVKTRLFRVPPKTPWADATHKVSGLEFLLLFVETDQEVSGIGLTYTVGVGGTAIKALLDDYCTPVLIGQRVDQIEAVWNLMWNHLHRTGSGGINTLALAAVDTALWDIASKRTGVPLWRLLGGSKSSIPVYGSGIDLLMSPDALCEHLSMYLKNGYGWVKIKVGRETVSEDVARLEAAREVIGDDTKLLLDANQCWSLDEAMRRVKAFERYSPYWIEEPLMCEDIAGHARLRSATDIPIAIGESLYGKYDFVEYLQADAVDVLQPDIARVGGFSEWIKIAHVAAAWNKPVAPHYLMELSLNAMCAVSNGLVLENVSGGGLAELGLIKRSIVIEDGVAKPSESLGIGFDFDFDALSQWEIESGNLTKCELLSYQG